MFDSFCMFTKTFKSFFFFPKICKIRLYFFRCKNSGFHVTYTYILIYVCIFRKDIVFAEPGKNCLVHISLVGTISSNFEIGDFRPSPMVRCFLKEIINFFFHALGIMWLSNIWPQFSPSFSIRTHSPIAALKILAWLDLFQHCSSNYFLKKSQLLFVKKCLFFYYALGLMYFVHLTPIFTWFFQNSNKWPVVSWSKYECLLAATAIITGHLPARAS